MRNHFHLALETPDANLSAGMKWLQATWVARFNRLRGIAGRPFQGRFKSLHVEPGLPLAEVSHYIHLNPVRAKVVHADEIRSFRWSSLYWFPRKDCPGSLDGFTVRSEAGALPDTRSGWTRYVAYLSQRAAEYSEKSQMDLRRLSRGWCVGSETFRREMKERVRRLSGNEQRRQFMALEPEERVRERGQSWWISLQAVANQNGISLKDLPPKKSAPEKVLLAAAMKRATDVSNSWLAEQLQMGTPASVSQFVRRFRFQDGENSTAFIITLSSLKPRE